MIAISLHQPYAYLLASGKKRFETRHWSPPLKYLGQRIAIHAAKKNDREVREAANEELGEDWQYRLGEVLAFGAIVGSGTLRNAGRVLSVERSGALHASWMKMRPNWRSHNPYVYEKDMKHGDFSVGRWLWEFDACGMKAYPIPARGRQSFWNCPEAD